MNTSERYKLYLSVTKDRDTTLANWERMKGIVLKDLSVTNVNMIMLPDGIEQVTIACCSVTDITWYKGHSKLTTLEYTAQLGGELNIPSFMTSLIDVYVANVSAPTFGGSSDTIRYLEVRGGSSGPLELDEVMGSLISLSATNVFGEVILPKHAPRLENLEIHSGEGEIVLSDNYHSLRDLSIYVNSLDAGLSIPRDVYDLNSLKLDVKDGYVSLPALDKVRFLSLEYAGDDHVIIPECYGSGVQELYLEVPNASKLSLPTKLVNAKKITIFSQGDLTIPANIRGLKYLHVRGGVITVLCKLTHLTTLKVIATSFVSEEGPSILRLRNVVISKHCDILLASEESVSNPSYVVLGGRK